MLIDWTISVGNILTVIIVGSGAMAAFFTLRGDVRVLKHDMRNVEVRQDSLSDSLAQVTQLLVQMAAQDQRIKGIEEDIRDLRHGKGFIK